jgi:siroheme synthase
MGVAARGAIAERLVRRGWDPETPAAVILGASSPGASRWTGPLRDLAAAPLPADRELPGTLVVGAVAALGLPVVTDLPHAAPAAAGTAGAAP